MSPEHATMVRAQILLTPEQRSRLQQLAQREGRTLADVTRRAIDAGLDTLEGHGEDRIRQRQAILAELDAIRLRIEREHGVYPGDLVAEVRAERDREMERV
jgi:hypothetical protein